MTDRPYWQPSLPGMATCQKEIRVQKAYDRKHEITWVTFCGRIQGIQSAYEAVKAGEYGAEYALRQGLIDLASCCELLAAGMPEPQVALPPVRGRRAA